MSRRRFLGLAVAAVLALSVALYLSARRNQQPDLHGAPLLPSLPGEMGTVGSVSLRRGKATPNVVLHQQNGHWAVAERGDYPADVPKLRKLLLALADARIVEEKTSNPASFAAIGVEDPTSPGAGGAEIDVTARDGTHAVIVGKPVGEGNFVRRGGENTSYSVEPGISFETEPRSWIDSHLPEISSAAIQSIEVKPAAGPGYTIVKTAAPATTAASAGKNSKTGATPTATDKDGAAPAPENFTLEGVPAGRKAAESALLAPSPNTFGGLHAEDVAPASDIDFSKASVVTLHESDGNVITLTGAAIGDAHWIEMQSSKDDAFNAKTAGHAFEIAGYRFDAIFRPLEQVLVPKPTPVKPPAKEPTHPPVRAPAS